MAFRLSDVFWRWGGTLDRGPYAAVAIALFALKHNIDRFVAFGLFDRPWSLFYYISPSDAFLPPTSGTSAIEVSANQRMKSGDAAMSSRDP